MKILFFISFLFFNSLAFSQVMFFNNGQNVFFNDSVIFMVKGGDFVNSTGEIQNEGHIYVEGHYTNDDITNGGNVNSEFVVLKDWENNADFTANQTTVILNGDNQSIKGSQESHFYNLLLENGNVKSLKIDASTSGILNLNTSELATTDYKMTVLNTAVDAIEFDEEIGFVSSTNDGRLVRNTNLKESYIFPIGENDNGLIYRPISIIPSTTNNNQYEARFVNANAGNDGYDFTLKEESVNDFNANFYHLINQSVGTEKANLNIFYKPSEDGDWESVGQWNNEWKNLDNTSMLNSTGFKKANVVDWLSNNDEPHILITKSDITAIDWTVPNIFTPNALQDENKVFTIINQLDKVTLVSMQIFDRWGQKVFDNKTDGLDYWDGYYKGEMQPPSNYVYLIQVKNKAGEISEYYSGDFLLVW